MAQRLKLFSLLAINLKDKSFRMVGLYLQVNIPPWLGKIFRFTMFKLLEKGFCETPPSLVCSGH